MPWNDGNTPCPEVTDLSASPHAYIMTGLTPGQQYYVRVSAFHTLGYGHLVPTTPASDIPPIQPPSAPTSHYHAGGSPTLYVVSHDALSVRWGPPDFDGGDTILQYKVEWDTSPAFNSEAITKMPIGTHIQLGGAAAEYTMRNLTRDTRWYVRVIAYNAERRYGELALTDPPSEVPREVPANPAMVSLAIKSGTSLTLAWSQAAQATTYRVEWLKRAAAAPHFGVREVQQIQLAAEALRVTIAAGPGAVSMEMTLAGETVATFDVAKQLSFRQTIADRLNVPLAQVAIISVSSAGRHHLRVERGPPPPRAARGPRAPAAGRLGVGVVPRREHCHGGGGQGGGDAQGVHGGHVGLRLCQAPG